MICSVVASGHNSLNAADLPPKLLFKDCKVWSEVVSGHNSLNEAELLPKHTSPHFAELLDVDGVD